MQPMRPASTSGSDCSRSMAHRLFQTAFMLPLWNPLLRKSKGWYAQGTYKIGKWKPGISYGESKLDLAPNEAANGTLVKSNKSLVLGLYYSLTPSLNLVAEYIPTTAKNQAGGEVKDKVMALGAILFF